jgi:hypothetical protein
LSVPSGRIVDVLNSKRGITADTALRLGRYFGNNPQFWMNLQSQYDPASASNEYGETIKSEVRKCAWWRQGRSGVTHLVEVLRGKPDEACTASATIDRRCSSPPTFFDTEQPLVRSIPVGKFFPIAGFRRTSVRPLCSDGSPDEALAESGVFRQF